MQGGWYACLNKALMPEFIAERFLLALFRHRQLLSLAVLSGSALLPAISSAYLIDGSKWLGGEAEFYVAIPGASASEISWNSAVIDGLNNWSANTVFNFTVVEENKDPCAIDGFSSIGFKEEICGSEFGENVLAVAVRRFELQELGPPNIVEGDIVVNSGERFDVFDGPLIQSGFPNTGVDFKRIALHELGHVIGLEHEEVSPAIMAPTLSDVFELQEDDIAGVNALYSGLDNCEIKQLSFGSSSEALSGDDCTVQELTVGGLDDSHIDLYQFEVSQSAQFEFSASSDTLDTVLLLATTDLEYLAVATGSSDDCNSTLAQTLKAGSYFLMVNTFDIPVNADCGVFGDYSLTANFVTEAQSQLGAPTSLLGSFSQASFNGGISADDGASFGNVFSPWDSLDIIAKIAVDPVHVGEPGFLLVAALLPDALLMLNEENQFVDVSAAGTSLTIYRRKLLAESEHLDIVNDLVPAPLGIFQLEANFVVGYGLDANPDEVYYHTTPMNLIIGIQAGDGN